MTVTLTAIEPASYPYFPYKGFTFCLGLRDGDAAWTSGQSAAIYDAGAKRMIVGGSMSEQAELSYEKLLAVIADAGLGPSDVVHVTENVTAAGAPFHDEAVGVRQRVFGTHEPTVTTVVVDRLVRGKALIELELQAVPGGGRALAGADAGPIASPVREGHDGAVHLPTVMPVDRDGSVVHVGDMVGIRADGLGSEHVGGTVVMARLLREGIDVSLDITLSRHPKSIVDPGWARFGQDRLVPALRTGTTLYLSALSARDRDTGTVVAAGDLGAQAEELYGQMAQLLSFAGLDTSSLRSTIEFCAADQIGNYRVVAGVRERYLSPPWPASTGDLCTGFPLDGVLLQTDAIAHLDS
jgi:enamine deaminase RidA (YjgF/YER057c/UK114 family)